MTSTATVRVAAIAAASLFVWTASGSDADAQARTYRCDKGKAITVNVTGPKSMSAGPIEGRTMQFKKSQQSPTKFFSGEYAVIMSPDGRRIDVEIPDFGTVKCSAGQDSATPQQGIGPTDPCGPGFQLVPGTKKCVRRPSDAQATPPKRAGSSCPPGFAPVPETDRCDPIKGAPAPRVAQNGGALPTCRDQDALRSPPGATAATELTFVNAGQESRRIFWIDRDGQRKFYKELGPHASYTQPTFVNHPWVIAREDDRCQTVVVAPPKPMLVDVTRACLTGGIGSDGRCTE